MDKVPLKVRRGVGVSSWATPVNAGGERGVRGDAGGARKRPRLHRFRQGTCHLNPELETFDTETLHPWTFYSLERERPCLRRLRPGTETLNPKNPRLSPQT